MITIRFAPKRCSADWAARIEEVRRLANDIQAFNQDVYNLSDLATEVLEQQKQLMAHAKMVSDRLEQIRKTLYLFDARYDHLFNYYEEDGAPQEFTQAYDDLEEYSDLENEVDGVDELVGEFVV